MEEKIQECDPVKVLKGSVTQLASEGRITLQVPEFEIAFDPSQASGFEELPDDWFIRARAGSGNSWALSVGKERGFLVLSQKGWEANKAKIKEVFMKAEHKRGTWEEFEQEAADTFSGLEESRQRRIKALEDKIALLKAAKY